MNAEQIGLALTVIAAVLVVCWLIESAWCHFAEKRRDARKRELDARENRLREMWIRFDMDRVGSSPSRRARPPGHVLAVAGQVPAGDDCGLEPSDAELAQRRALIGDDEVTRRRQQKLETERVLAIKREGRDSYPETPPPAPLDMAPWTPDAATPPPDSSGGGGEFGGGGASGSWDSGSSDSSSTGNPDR